VSLLRRPWLHALVGAALGAVFLYAAYDKILHPADFARIVYHYQLIGPNQHVGPWASNLLAVTLPWLEVVLGVALVTGFWRREAAALTSVLLVVFVVAVSAALLRGIDIENCGCFSVTGEGRSAGIKLIAADLLMLAGGLVLALVTPRKQEAAAPVGTPQAAL
jgi:putative oxidoreductase